jgi:predicted  nucleic acid-binding Zn-ribbon protein
MLATKADIREMERKIMTTQAEVDGLTTELGAVKSSLVATQTDVTTLATGIGSLEKGAVSLQAQITDLEAKLAAAGTPLDLTAAKAAADDLVASAGVMKTAADAAVASLPPSA